MSLTVKYTSVFEDLIGKKSAKYLINRLFIVSTCCSDNIFETGCKYDMLSYGTGVAWVSQVRLR